VPISKVVAETPELNQGDTTENPSPAPNDNKTNVNAQEAIAPARTAAQEIPATDGSTISSITTSFATPTGRITCSIKSSQRFEFDAGEMVEREEGSLQETDSAAGTAIALGRSPSARIRAHAHTQVEE
jgi:predicted phage gp36 major capsid-like protein